MAQKEECTSEETKQRGENLHFQIKLGGDSSGVTLAPDHDAFGLNRNEKGDSNSRACPWIEGCVFSGFGRLMG